MNMHVPQSIQTQIELEELTSVQLNIINPRFSLPMIAPKQDGVVGAYLISGNRTVTDWKSVMNYSMYLYGVDHKNMGLEKDKQINGSDVYSMILDPDYNMVTMADGKKIFDINNGKLLTGTFGKGSIKTTLVAMWDKLGPERTKFYIDNNQRLTNQWLMNDGFTVGYGDALIPNDLRQKILTLSEAKKLEIDTLITQMENNPDSMDAKLFEEILTSNLGTTREDFAKLAFDNLNNNNNFFVMVKSGAKGSPTNIGEIMSIRGQDKLMFKRIPKRMNKRTLPHFCQNDDSAIARGYMEHSFIDGLTGYELFFHVMSGREGLIDTAVKSVTGDTPIVILENGETKVVKIGDWIDRKLELSEDKVERFKERDMELLRIDRGEIYIPTADYSGNVSWGKIEAITRHDPGKDLYEIKTLGGKQVIVTESKSLLIWNEKTKQFEMKSTPEVKVGDFVPSTMHLPEPPQVNNYIDMTCYFPKEWYVYGTDFNIACKEIKKVLKTDGKTPDGWWEKNNGELFTLPYEHAHRVMRAERRSAQILPGYVYPYDASREHVLMPDKFLLNKENGMFIGLFLAEGNADIPSGYVQITNKNERVKKFVESYFDKLRMTHYSDEYINQIGGITSYVRGFSKPLAQFLTSMVGHGARNKHVPNEAFNAPEEFIIGLLDGYISGDGSISENSIAVGSASFELVTGINMLLTRLKIFAHVGQTQMKENNLGTKDIAKTYVLSIRGQWAKTFAEKISILDDNKQKQLEEMKPSSLHRNYQEQNDVVLDKIVEINIIDTAKYPKVYDLTVPSTLNFGLANGLHVVDTADTGYTQRKLVKALEDLMITYDFTVRGSNGVVAQYLYGDSGINTTMQKKQKLGFINMSNNDIKTELCFTDDNLPDKNFKSLNDDFYKFMIELRDELREVQMKARVNYLYIESDYFLPVDFTRVISDIKKVTKGSKLTPQYVLERIEYVLRPDVTKLMAMPKKNLDNKKSLKYQDQYMFKRLFEMALYDKLCPKKCIIDYQLDKEGFDAVIQDVINSFNRSLINSGEMVGCLSAQCMGAPLTQMSTSRNSAIFYSRLKGKKTIDGINEIKTEKIGTVIDDMFEEYKDDLRHTGYLDSYELELPKDEEFYIPSVTKDEKVEWKRVSHISRHPANGKLVKVTTYTGREIITTPNHSHLIRSEKGIKPMTADQLQVKQRIPICWNLPYKNDEYLNINFHEEDLTFDFDHITGWFFGGYLAEGYVKSRQISLSNVSVYYGANCQTFANKYGLQFDRVDHKGQYGPGCDNIVVSDKFAKHITKYYNKGSFDKVIPDYVFDSSLEFIAGLLRGYFDGDGNVDSTKNVLRCGSRSKELIRGIALLLSYFKINTSFYEETKDMTNEDLENCLKRKEVQGKHFFYDDKRQVYYKILYCLSIAQKDIPVFYERIGTDFADKKERFEKICKFMAAKEVNGKTNDKIDMIPALGKNIANLGKNLKMPGQSETYGRFDRDKKNIGRRTLKKYMDRFDAKINEIKKSGQEIHRDILNDMTMLNNAYESDLIWDEIVKIEWIADPKDYVYDLTIPGTETFMTSDGIMVHNTLNTFHSSGSGSSGMQGVPRFKELIACTKEIKEPITTIYFDDKTGSNKNLVNKIASHIKYITIEDVLTKTEIIYDPTNDGYSKSDNTDNIFFVEKSRMLQKQGPEVVPWLLRIHLDKEKVIDRDINMLDVKTKFVQFWNDKYSDSKKVKKEEKDVVNNINHVGIAATNDNAKELIIHIRFDLNTINMDLLNDLNNLIINNFKLKGINNVTGIDKIPEEQQVSIDNTTGEVKRITTNVILTKGINMIDIRKIKGVDLTRTICNSTYDVFELFGIEAARAFLIKEIFSVFMNGGNEVNYQHIELLVDMMSNTGGLTSIDRHGINRLDTDPLSRASFEKIVEQFVNAAIYNEVDLNRSVSSRIMTGRCYAGGTGAFDLIFDHEMIENSEYINDMETTQVKKFTENTIIKDNLKKKHTKVFIP